VSDDRLEQLNDMRRLLDWLEQHPSVPLPTEFDNGLNIFRLDTKDEAIQLAKTFGSCEKRFNENMLYLTKRFGSTKLTALFTRSNVCERVVVGREVVPEQVTAAYEREIVQWKCEPILEPNGDGEQPEPAPRVEGVG